MKLKKRADGRYQLKVTLPNGQTKFVYGRTQKEVQEKKADLLVKYGKGVTVFKNITMGEWSMTWWKTRKEGSTGYTDQKVTTAILRKHILPGIGGYKLQEIRPVTIETFISSVEGSRALHKRILSVLNNIFRFAVENGLLYGNPAQYVKPKGRAEEPRLALTKEQQEELLKACKGTSGETMILLAYYLGLRRGEAIGLHWTDIDRENHTVHVQRAVEMQHSRPVEKDPKTKAGNRIIPIPDVLWVHLQGLEKKSVFVICNRDGSQVTLPGFANKMRSVRKRLSFPLTYHQLRHTYATNLDLMGISPKACQYLLGHASIQMTKGTYTHIQEEHLEQVRKILTTF